MKRCDLKDFILKAKKVHKNKYDYSKFKYVNNKTKGIIICPKHGEFIQRPNDHLTGKGCKSCGYIKLSIIDRNDRKEKFILRAKKAHENKYDYSKFKYVNNRTKGIIICPEHGEFIQTAIEHLCGSICPCCKRIKAYERFVSRAKEIHGNKYDYSKFKYINNITKGIIICPNHGEFLQIPINHLSKRGCPKCGILKTIKNNTKNIKQFIKQASKKHNNKYDYSESNYTGIFEEMEIICPIHGRFKQCANNHLRGSGCQLCSRIIIKDKITKSTKEFIEKANKVHHFKYDYSESNYIGAFKKIKIICPIHGGFEQKPSNHLNGNGCLSCSRNSVSRISQKWLDMLDIPIKCREKLIIIGDKKYIPDAFVEETGTIYEFYGDYWHGNPQKYDGIELNIKKGKSFGQLYKETIEREKVFKNAGFKIVSIWESEFFVIMNEK